MLKTKIALVASLGLLLAGQAGAAEASANKATQQKLTFEGDITSVDVPDKEFTVKSTGKGATSEMTFQVGRQTSILIDGQLGLLGELQKGEHVTVTYEMSGSTYVSIHLHRHKKTS